MNKHLIPYNIPSNKGNLIYTKNDYENPNNLSHYYSSLPIQTKDIKKLFLNDSRNIEKQQNKNLNSNRNPVIKKEMTGRKKEKDELPNENNNNFNQLILYEIQKLNQYLIRLNDSTNKIDGKIDGINQYIRNKRERTNDEVKSPKKNKNINHNKNNMSSNIYIKKEKLFSKNIDDALEQYVNNLNSNENYVKSTLFTDTQSLNINLNENDKIISNYNINVDLSNYFEFDNENIILYGCPLNSPITITNDNKIYYPDGNDSKIYIIIGKEEIRFDNNFKYQFQINKKGSRGVTLGFLNINDAIKQEFGPIKCKNCGFFLSSGKKIFNYLFKGQKDLKCNEIKDNSIIIFEYKINNNYIDVYINDFQTQMNIDFREIGDNNEFRIALFISKNGFIQVEKIT